MRPAFACLAVALLSATIVAQTPTTSPIYNPKGFEFEHDLVGGWDITDHYQFGIVEDRGIETLLNYLWTADVPKSAVQALPTPEGATVGTFRVPMQALPAIPVGKSYRAAVYAVDAEQRASFPSNLTPEAFRFNACALESATGVQLPSLAVSTWPALKVGQGVTLTLAIKAPHDVQFITLDLTGDGQPAWYYVTKVPVGTPSTAAVFWGPFPRAGTFEVAGQIIDSGGCQASLPAGTKVTISP